MEYGSHVWGDSTHTALLNRVEYKAFRLNSPPLTDCLDSLSHRRNVASLSIFYRYFHTDCSFELANYMPSPSRALAIQDFLLLLIPILSIFLMQELTVSSLSSLTLVKSGTLFLWWLKLLQKRSVKTPIMLYELHPLLYSSYCLLCRVWRQAGFFLMVLYSLGQCPFNVKKSGW